MKIIYIIITVVFPFLLISCNSNVLEDELNECNSSGLLESFTTPDGYEIYIYKDGKAYLNDNGSCTFALQYFEPGFLENNYLTNDSGTFIITGDGELFPTKSNFFEDFENYSTFTGLFINSLDSTHLYWTDFTLQSPSAPEISDYVKLRQCILNGTCTFIDNKIELANDPTNNSNQVLKFTSVPPSSEMITAKSSIASSLNYYLKDSEVWFQADYYIESGMPFSLADFENSYFDKRPGPRIVVFGNKLAVENKFGAKISYTQNTGISIPLNQWFTVKLHLKYSNENDGIIELWQDDVQVISATGINLPTYNSIQNVLEVGVTATPIGCVLLIDNMRISNKPF